MSTPRHAVAEDLVELLISVVVAADNADQARNTCERLVNVVEGWIVDARDCSAEEPGCWSVTVSKMWPGDSTNPAEVVRDFVRTLGDGFDSCRIAFEPPTAWVVLDDPELLAQLVPGGERILVEAWLGDSPHAAPSQEIAWPTVDEPVWTET